MITTIVGKVREIMKIADVKYCCRFLFARFKHPLNPRYRFRSFIRQRKNGIVRSVNIALSQQRTFPYNRLRVMLCECDNK